MITNIIGLWYPLVHIVINELEIIGLSKATCFARLDSITKLTNFKVQFNNPTNPVHILFKSMVLSWTGMCSRIRRS